MFSSSRTPSPHAGNINRRGYVSSVGVKVAVPEHWRPGMNEQPETPNTAALFNLPFQCIILLMGFRPCEGHTILQPYKTRSLPIMKSTWRETINILHTRAWDGKLKQNQVCLNLPEEPPGFNFPSAPGGLKRCKIKCR